jgi:hypothetical protein
MPFSFSIVMLLAILALILAAVAATGHAPLWVSVVLTSICIILTAAGVK